ncbi:MAG: hypothetical protein DRG27_06245, partial [Deltaproteobacteria bacterium]
YLIDPAKLEKAPLYQLAIAFDKLDHAYRLASNQATENIDIRSLNLSLHELKKQRAELEAELSVITKQLESMPDEQES